VTDEHLQPALDRLADTLRITMRAQAVRANEPLARYTALRIGGPADLLAVVESAQMLRQAVTVAWENGVPCRVLGGGSNVLVSDTGVRGLVVLNRARAVTFVPRRQGGGETVKAESGVSFSTLAQQCVTRGLAGLEWAVGIPGTVGGAVSGNAGAWGSNVASTLVRATILEPGGMVTEWPVERFEYEYRSSTLKRQAQRAIILEAEFALQAEDRKTLKARVAEITAQRKASQPPGATCGSVFKNPPGDYAGRLIETAGLKGQRRGGAEISSLHANFIVNRGEATATDVTALIALARKAVQLQFGVALELEIELVGEWRTSRRDTSATERENQHVADSTQGLVP
jgi:UDP-N-acetylmuramate dehydrogenase